jgi:hypothetical protein
MPVRLSERGENVANGVYEVLDVFTPTKPARLTYVERDSINDRLVSALRTPGKQLVVYGHSGCGKTTLLLNKLHQLYEKHLTSRCMRGVTFNQLLLDAFDQLRPYYVSEKGTNVQTTVSAQLSAEYASIRSQIAVSHAATTHEKSVPALPQQLTPQALGRFLGAARACWVLEDFHKMDDGEKAPISQLMKVFMDMADDFRELKIVAIGAVDTARQVVQYDPEMLRRVAEIQVPLMTAEELNAIIEKGEQLLNIKFPTDVKSKITWYSNGLASVCHHLCLNMCDVCNVERTQAETTELHTDALDLAFKRYLEEASDTLKQAFDKALRRKRTRKYDNTRIILRAMSQVLQTGATVGELHQRIRRVHAQYPAGNLNEYLRRLLTEDYGAILRYDGASGRYSFSDPLYRVFAVGYFEQARSSAQEGQDEVERVIAFLRRSISSVKPGDTWQLIFDIGKDKKTDPAPKADVPPTE